MYREATSTMHAITRILALVEVCEDLSQFEPVMWDVFEMRTDLDEMLEDFEAFAIVCRDTLLAIGQIEERVVELEREWIG